MQPPELSPHLQAPLTHTHSTLPLKHLKSSVCAVRVNSFCTCFAWFIIFGNIYVQLFGKRNLKYAATQARVVKQLPPGILTRGPRITDLCDQGDHNIQLVKKQSWWSGQLGDHPIKVIRAAWWSGWTRRRRASSCASSPPAPTFQSLKTFVKNSSFLQSLRLAGTTTTKALKLAVTAAMTPGTTSLATVIPRMSCYIKFTFFCVVMCFAIAFKFLHAFIHASFFCFCFCFDW